MLTEYNLQYGTLAMYLYIVRWFISVKKKQKWIKLLLIDVLLVVPFVLLISRGLPNKANHEGTQQLPVF